MLSFWEKESYTQYDYVIIGGGLVGLSTACSLLEKNRNLKVVVLERGIFPSGASTRNAGFACFAKACEMLSDLNLQSEEYVVKLAYDRFTGLQQLRKRLGDDAIGYHQWGGHELILHGEEFDADKIAYLNDLLLAVFGETVFRMRDDLISSYGFRNVKHIIHTGLEGQVHSGKLMQALTSRAQQLGASILTGCEVMELSESNGTASCTIRHHHIGRNIEISADVIAVCTSAFTSPLIPDSGIKPGRGQVLITSPINSLRIKGTFHFNEGYYYFRNVGNRVLFGGGRNMDFAGETTPRFDYNDQIQHQLDKYLYEVILPGQDYEIEQRWAGIMGFTSDKKPVVTKVSERIVLGFSCNGMGVALGTFTGEKVAALMSNRSLAM